MKVKFFATYRNITNRKETDIPAPPDIRALLAWLGETYGEAIRKELLTPDGENIGSNAIILVNGRNIQFLEGIDTTLSESVTISIFPVVAGG